MNEAAPKIEIFKPFGEAFELMKKISRSLAWLAANLTPFVLFCLFGIVLLLAMIVTAGIVSCVTCCVAGLPYVGTMILLPVYICVRAFGLLFLRQFGPDYDVWATLPPPESPPISPASPV